MCCKTCPRIRAKRLAYACAITIAVGIGVVGGEGKPFIYLRVAIVVNAVANFVCRRVDFLVGVIAIAVQCCKTWARIRAKRLPYTRTVAIAVGIGVVGGEGNPFVNLSVAIVVNAIADFVCRRVDFLVGVIAIAV